jgi:hypothetical protein
MDPVDRWLTGETIQPKRLSDWERVSIWIRQHPHVSSLSAAVLIAALAIPIASLVAYSHTADALRLATIERDAAEKERVDLSAAVAQKADELKKQDTRCQNQLREHQELENNLRQLQASYEQSRQQCQAADQHLKDALREARLSMAEDFSRQAQEFQKGLPEVSLVLAAKALIITQQEGVPPISTALQQSTTCERRCKLRGHEGPVAQLVRVATAVGRQQHHQGLSGFEYHVRQGARQPALPMNWGRITQLTFTADSRWLVSGSTDSTAHLWKLESTDHRTAPLLLRTSHGSFVSLAVSDNGRWLAIAGAGHVTNDVFVRLWDLHANDVLASCVDLPSYQGQLCSLAVSRDGDRVATGNEDGFVRLWQLNNQTGAVIATDLHLHGQPVCAIRFAPDGRSLITAAGRTSGKGTVRSWSLENTDAAADAVLADNSSGVELFALTSDGRWLFTADEEPSLRVRDLTALDEEKAGKLLEGQSTAVQAMALSADDHWLATAGTDNTVRMWYVGANGPAATPIAIRIPRGLVTSVAFAGKGDWLATGNDCGNIQLWNLRVDDLIRIANARMLR